MKDFAVGALLLLHAVGLAHGFSPVTLSVHQHRHASPSSRQQIHGLALRAFPNDSQPGQSASSIQQVATTAADWIQSDETTTTAETVASSVEKPPFPIVLWRFTRPHTLIGSALAIPSLHFLAAPTLAAALQAPFWSSIMFCTVPSLLMNLYITGLNQITDVDIDKINKPNLPIAAGILSKRTAIVTVVASLVGSLYMGQLPGSTQGLRVALWGSAILGTMYSLPPFRLKRFPLWAAFCIVAVRGTIINASFFAHAKNMGVIPCLLQDSACFLSSLFYCVFGVVIALMKDVPDVAGDVSSNVKTFSVRLGQERMFNLGKGILVTLFGAFAMGFARGALLAPTTVLMACRGAIGAACVGAAASVQVAARGVNPMDSAQVYEYYMHLWKWFYLSYLALPFAR